MLNRLNRSFKLLSRWKCSSKSPTYLSSQESLSRLSRSFGRRSFARTTIITTIQTAARAQRVLNSGERNAQTARRSWRRSARRRPATSPHNTNSRRVECDYQPGPGEQAVLCARWLTILRCSPRSVRRPVRSFTSSFASPPTAPAPLATPPPPPPPHSSLAPSFWITLFVALSVRHARTQALSLSRPTTDLSVLPSAPSRFSSRSPALPLRPRSQDLSRCSPPIESTNYSRRPEPGLHRGPLSLSLSCVKRVRALIIAISSLGNLSGAISGTARHRVNLARPM